LGAKADELESANRRYGDLERVKRKVAKLLVAGDCSGAEALALEEAQIELATVVHHYCREREASQAAQ
jgi:hypothetical protein